ncbi:hypothetical protein DSO57_1009265 [Entomophthora muscae]|uniref:Uncharacterized protein n=1 Tax=Entomophthora muscae TaxID=34485 RepID=A0ACC2UGA5_9FUNG|nr:hypothetical protein DSO57_1009265 [Entomophthora muscae]
MCESTIHYKHAYLFPPGSAPITLVKLSRVLDLEFYHPHYLDLPSGHPRVTVPPSMKEISTTPPSTQRTSCSGFQIAPIVFMALQAWPASPVGVQLDSVWDMAKRKKTHFIVGFLRKIERGTVHACTKAKATTKAKTKGLDVQAFWLPATYLTSNHCPI